MQHFQRSLANRREICRIITTKTTRFVLYISIVTDFASILNWMCFSSFSSHFDSLILCLYVSSSLIATFTKLGNDSFGANPTWNGLYYTYIYIYMRWRWWWYIDYILYLYTCYIYEYIYILLDDQHSFEHCAYSPIETQILLCIYIQFYNMIQWFMHI